MIDRSANEIEPPNQSLHACNPHTVSVGCLFLQLQSVVCNAMYGPWFMTTWLCCWLRQHENTVEFVVHWTLVQFFHHRSLLSWNGNTLQTPTSTGLCLIWFSHEQRYSYTFQCCSNTRLPSICVARKQSEVLQNKKSPTSMSCMDLSLCLSFLISVIATLSVSVSSYLCWKLFLQSSSWLWPNENKYIKQLLSSISPESAHATGTERFKETLWPQRQISNAK